METSDLQVSRKAVLVVLFIPSVERDGITSVNQDYWVTEALRTFGRLYGGATAFPRARGVWRDDEMGAVLVEDEPIRYTTPDDLMILSVLPSSGVSAEEWDVRHVKEKWGS